MIRRALFAAAACALMHATSATAATCDSLAVLPLQNAHVTAAQMVAAGTFTPPAPPVAPGREGAAGRAGAAGREGAAGRGGARGGGRGNQPSPYAMLPSFCRVAVTLTPSSDSDIRIEVWLPTQWNGRFQAVGNGAWAGTIPYGPMAGALLEGYATAGTDTGHVGNNAAFAIGHPEKIIDLGYRSVHEMTVQAKTLINSFYGRAQQFSIWNGCSQGGRQGITAAVRYPTDFDGVIAGAPAVNWMNLHAGRMAANRAAN